MTILILALSSAFFVGLNQVLIRKSLDSISRTQALFVSLATSTILVWIVVAIITDFSVLVLSAVVIFLVVGVLGPGIGRTLNITSSKRIGVSRTLPITGVAPFFATVVAIIFLGEEYSLYIFAGTVLIIVGIFVLSRGRNASGVRYAKKDLLLPLGSAAFGGISIALTKQGLLIMNEPILAAAISITAAFVGILGYAVLTKRTRYIRVSRSSSKILIFAGCSMAAAFMLNFSALKFGSVSIVAPVFSTFPLFGVFLSHFILKEQITSRMWIGAIIIIIGVAFIQVF